MGRIKKVGMVEFEEAERIYKIFMRKKALEELELISDKLSNSLKLKLKQEYELSNSQFYEWWDEMSDKYSFDIQENCQWEIDFDTYEIFLTETV